MRETKDLSVLIAEDDPAILHLAKAVLTKEGFTVETCTNGEDAIIAIRARRFDLVICDESMPKATGTAVAEYLRQNPDSKHIPFIMISAENNSKHFTELLQKGIINLFLPKPYSPTLLINMTRCLLQIKTFATNEK